MLELRMFSRPCLLPLLSFKILLKPQNILFFSSSSRSQRLTKQACIALLQYCKSMKELKQIHSQVFRACLHENRDSLNKLLVFCASPEYGDLQYAEKIFRTIQDPSLFAYNLMIKAFAKKGSMRKSIWVFDRLREDGLSPDNFTFPLVLKAMGSLKAVSEGRKTHGVVIKTGFEFDSYVRNSLMDVYAEMGLVETSRDMFDEMPDRDLVSWNVMISGYVKCRRFQEAVTIFRQMEGHGVQPDEATLASTLAASASMGDLELGKKIHGYIGGEVIEFSIILGNALLDMYVKCGSLSLAHQFFDHMPAKNVISWTSLISGYANCGKLDEARELFDRSPVRDVILWTAMINGYVLYNQFNEALIMFREMQLQSIKPDRYTVVSLLTACAHLGALEQGKWIHGYIEDNMIKIDAIVSTALIDMYAKCGYIEKSIEVFRRSKEKDTASWTATICGLAMNGKTRMALELFSVMEHIGTKPDDITFIGVLSACNHGGLVEEGYQFFDLMRRVYHIEPKVEHYGCLVDLLSRAGQLKEAEELIEKVPNNNEMLPLWGSLLAACRVHGNVEMGERVAKRLAELECSNSGTHTLLANIYAAANRWKDVTKVRRKMKDLGVKKIPGCSSIEVDGVVYEFLVGDNSHPEIGEIYSVLNNMARPLDLEAYVADG